MATTKLTHPLDSSRTAPAIKHLPKPLEGWEAVSDAYEREGYGQVLFYEATAAELIAAGLVDACDLPDPSSDDRRIIDRTVGNNQWFVFCSRSDNLMHLQISAHLVRQRDAGFVDFMAMTVGRAIVNIAAKP